MHISIKSGKGILGTLRFASLSATLGREQSRKDDLEALGYMCSYFLNQGKLPWMGCKSDRTTKKL